VCNQFPELWETKEYIIMATAKKKLVEWRPTDIKEELLKKYPPKVASKRAKQILINEALENRPRKYPPTCGPFPA
jgi:hypothetical protein